jgi:flavorubredoxin
MRIAILFHSKTGTTRKFAEIIAARLAKKNHTAEIIELATDVPVKTNSSRQKPDFRVTNLPDCAAFDAVLVGGPVWGLAVSPVVAVCLQGLKLHGKKFIPFVTMGFPLPGMGGKQAMAFMSKAAAAAGARVLPGKIVPKMFHRPAELMAKAAAEIAEQLA